VSQYIFYNGDWPSQANGRYNIPGVLAGPYLLFIIVLLLFEMLDIETCSLAKRASIRLFTLLIVLIAETDLNTYGIKQAKCREDTKYYCLFDVARAAL
jgi:hypothetical protein